MGRPPLNGINLRFTVTHTTKKRIFIDDASQAVERETSPESWKVKPRQVVPTVPVVVHCGAWLLVANVIEELAAIALDLV